jgi:hypothetical protein
VADSCVPLVTALRFAIFNYVYSCFLPLCFILTSPECPHTTYVSVFQNLVSRICSLRIFVSL